MNKNKEKVLLSPNPLILSDSFSNIYSYVIDKHINDNNYVLFYVNNCNKKCFGLQDHNILSYNKYIIKPYSMFKITKDNNISKHLKLESIIVDKNDIDISKIKLNVKFFKLECLNDNLKLFNDNDIELILSINDLLEDKLENDE